MQLDAETRKKLAEMSRNRILKSVQGYGHSAHFKPAQHSPHKKFVLVKREEPGRDIPPEQIRRTHEIVETAYGTPTPEIEKELGITQNLAFQNEVLDYMKSLQRQGVYLFNFSLKVFDKTDPFVYWANNAVYNAENTDFFKRRLGAFLVNTYSPFVLPEETAGILSTYANIDAAGLHKVLGLFDQSEWEKLRTARGTIDQLLGAGNEVTGIYELGKDKRR